jgi:divalent metal cation (Fe/Co/Zn/Cd) transporter
MDLRKAKSANVSVSLVLLVGAASFFASYIVLGFVAFCVFYGGKLQILSIAPEPFPWLMPTIIGCSFSAAVIVVRQTLRLSKNKPAPRRMPYRFV